MCNRQRTKTNEQIGRESAALMGIETERAKRRQAEAGKSAASGRPAAKKDREPNPTHSPKKEQGRARDKAGEKTGVSGKTAQRIGLSGSGQREYYLLLRPSDGTSCSCAAERRGHAYGPIYAPIHEFLTAARQSATAVPVPRGSRPTMQLDRLQCQSYQPA